MADLISYVSYQTLRFSHKLKNELKDVPVDRYDIIKEIRSEFRDKDIELIDISEDKFKYKKS